MALVKAQLEVVEGSNKGLIVVVHFNPQSLRLGYRTTGFAGTVKRKKRVEKQEVVAQQTGYGSDLSMELLFDTSQSGKDVRGKTLKIAKMLQPCAANAGTDNTAAMVPIVRFSWGTFLFVGTISSMNETIDLFSEQGKPLRATVNLSMSEVALERATIVNPVTNTVSMVGASPGGGAAIGTTPLTLSQAGDTLQNLVGRLASGGSWKAIANVNNIDNPRLIQPGTVLNLNVSGQ
jgi:hypothetical protein